MMQWGLFSIFLFIFSVFSLSNAMPDQVCMDGLGPISEMAKKQLGPPFDKLVCSKGIKPGKKDWKWLEPKIPMILNAIKKCPEKPILPDYKPKLEKLGDTIVKRCVKPNHNLCKEEDLKVIKGCAVSEALGWAMMNMDMLKYTDKPNCEKLVACLTKPAPWKVGVKLIEAFAKYKGG